MDRRTVLDPPFGTFASELLSRLPAACPKCHSSLEDAKIYKTEPWLHFFFIPVLRLKSSSTNLEAYCGHCDARLHDKCSFCGRRFLDEENYCPKDGTRRG